MFLLLVIIVCFGWETLPGEGSVYRRGDVFGFGGPTQESEESRSPFLSETANFSAEDFEKQSVSAPNATVLGGLIPGGELLGRDGLRKYRTQKGDNLSSLAAKFGVSVETIRAANPHLTGRLLQPDQELTILPVSGILYLTKEEDSLESVAARYQISPDSVREYNKDYQQLFDSPGHTVILPYAKALGDELAISHAATNLPNLKSYFALPAIGWNWGELHPANAVDIANSCGTPVYAAAEGLVRDDAKLGEGDEGWNAGYGVFVLIEHPNGTMTRYAHLEKKTVSVGDYVSQGDKIGTIGNSGNTHGPTGCHVHFEVIGARNPFAVR